MAEASRARHRLQWGDTSPLTEDVLGDAVLVTWRALITGRLVLPADPEEHSSILGTYLMRVGRRLLWQRLQAAAVPDQHAHAPHPSVDTRPQLEARSTLRRLDIHTLPKHLRETVEAMVELGERTHGDDLHLAEILRVPVGTVYTRVRQLRLRVQRRLRALR